MARSPLNNDGYRPQFSGHETFPLRYGWLKKAYDAVYDSEDESANLAIFRHESAIAHFGVGKNMVSSIRHWATAAGIIEDVSKSSSIETTTFGRKLFNKQGGLDPYMEHPATLWLLHWHIAGRPDKTTWYWAFNHYQKQTFDRDHLVKGLVQLASQRGWRVAEPTVKRDVECFVRTYLASTPSGGESHEDALESPLAELGLIKAVGKRDGFRFARGPKSTLGQGVFTYALLDFWKNYSDTQTLSFETLAYEAGSPGRVFLLDENDLAERLTTIEDSTHGAIRWSETAGLKQIIRSIDFDSKENFKNIEADYCEHQQLEVA